MLSDLWICSDKPPCSQAGIAWQAVQEIKTPDTGRKKEKTGICSAIHIGGIQKNVKIPRIPKVHRYCIY